MAYSRTKIANLAFGFLEVPPVSNIDSDKEPASDILRSMWDVALDAALVAHTWNFAIGRWNGRAPVVASRNPAPDVYGYAFERPADCLQVLEINPDRDNRGDAYVVEGDYILGDFATANVRGIKRITQPGKYSVWFIQYFAPTLAWYCCKDLSASQEIKDKIEKAQLRALAVARSADGREGTPPPIFRSTWLRAREVDCDQEDDL